MLVFLLVVSRFFLFKQKTAYEMRISDWSSDVCSSDLPQRLLLGDDRLEAVEIGLALDVEVLVALALDDRAGLVLDKHERTGAENVLLVPQIGRASCRERVCQYV